MLRSFLKISKEFKNVQKIEKVHMDPEKSMNSVATAHLHLYQIKLYQNTTLPDRTEAYNSTTLKFSRYIALRKHLYDITTLPDYNSTRIQFYQNITLRRYKCFWGKSGWPVGMMLLCRCHTVIASVRPGLLAKYFLLNAICSIAWAFAPALSKNNRIMCYFQ